MHMMLPKIPMLPDRPDRPRFALPVRMRENVGSHTGMSHKEGALTTPFVDPAFKTEKKPALSSIGLTGDAEMDLAIGVKIDGAPADALDYIKSISK